MAKFESLIDAVEAALPLAIAYIDAVPDENKALSDQDDMRAMLKNGVPGEGGGRDGYIITKALYLGSKYLALGPREPEQLESAASLLWHLGNSFRPDVMRVFEFQETIQKALSRGYEPEEGSGIEEARAFLAQQPDYDGTA